MSMSRRSRAVAIPAAVGAVAVGLNMASASSVAAYGITQAEYNHCVSSVSTAVKCLWARTAADQAYEDTYTLYGTNADFGKPNAFQHAWWVSLIAINTNDREFAWTITMLHETGYPNWETDNAHQMDLHNNRVGYHKVGNLNNATLEQVLAYKHGLKALADVALRDSDGVNTDYTRLIYIS